MQNTQTSQKSPSCFSETPQATGVQRSAKCPEVRLHPAGREVRTRDVGSGSGLRLLTSSVWSRPVHRAQLRPGLCSPSFHFHYLCNISTSNLTQGRTKLLLDRQMPKHPAPQVTGFSQVSAVLTGDSGQKGESDVPVRLWPVLCGLL